MSTRALRKVRKLRETDEDPGDESSDLENSTEIATSATRVNPFCLLEDDEENPGSDNASPEELASIENVQTKKKGKQKKKSKNKNKKQNSCVTEEEDIEKVLQELNTSVNNSQTLSQESSAADNYIPLTALLTVEHRYLNADNEMKRIFGARVVNSGARGRGNQKREMQRSTWLVRKKETWPILSKSGLSMTFTESKQGVQYFTFEHNKWYQEAQFLFLDAIESSDPQNIMNILKLHPYHTDSLLQLSEFCKVSEDVQTASDLLERALYVFETKFHSLFNMTKGNCRLDYRRPENRGFYLAIFRHLIFAGDRGCYRTALELCKLLLSLDPVGDPLCVLLMIDFYAIQSEEYEFLIRLYHELESDRNLLQLPNFAFSIPLAMFLKAEKENQPTDEASRLLQEALMMFPAVLLPLLEKCSIQPDGKVAKSTFFLEISYTDEPKAIQMLQMLYVGRCWSCWKLPSVVQWMEGNVNKVMTRVQAKDPTLEEYAARRKSRYRGTPRNIYRHIVISDIKDVRLHLPPDMAHTPILSHDPLPPTDSIQSYDIRERIRRPHEDSLSLLLRSLLPNYNPREPAEAAGADGGAEQARQGWDRLVHGLRDLFNNVNFVPPPVENIHNEEEDHNQDFD